MAIVGDEIELRLIGAPQTVAETRRSAIFKALTGGKGEWRRVQEMDYDTPGRALGAQGFSLCLYQEAGERIQTVRRCSPAEGSIGRQDSKKQLAPAEVFPAATGDLEFDAPLAVIAGQIKCVSTTITDIWSCTVRYKKSRIECGFHVGRRERLTGEGGYAPFGWIGLRGVKGSPDELFSFARLIVRESELRPTIHHAYGQESELLTGKNEITPMQKVILTGGETAGEALQKGLRVAADRVAALAPLIVEARKETAIQQIRVALRRFRTLERVYRPYLQDEKFRRLARRARNIGRRLAGARDWDVFLDETLPPFTSDGYAPEGFMSMRSKSGRYRAGAWDDAAVMASRRRFRVFTLDLLEAAYLAPWRAAGLPELQMPVHAFSMVALDRRLVEVHEIARTIAARDYASRHRLRIALKRLRYTAQTYRTLYDKADRKPYMQAMSKLQSALGGINDALTAQRLSDQAAKGEGDEAVRASGFIYGSHALQIEEAVKQADLAYAAFERLTPFWRSQQ